MDILEGHYLPTMQTELKKEPHAQQARVRP